MKKNDTILAIESSCDDTSAAVVRDGKILSNVTTAQIIHAVYGGVVPELASRQHQQLILPVVKRALEFAKVSKKDLNAIAFTIGPGLLGSLVVGVSFAKSFALALNIPMIEVNHMQAHILAHFGTDNPPPFPFLCLTVSGGHTQLVIVRDYFTFELLGGTLDDAAGEAFDKSGKILGLEYPAGPIIDKIAQQGEAKYKFSEPRIEGFNFSFSGLKTSILYMLQKNMTLNPNFITENLNDICASIQKAIIDTLLKKLRLAQEFTGIQHVAIAGGVSANSGLRNALKSWGETTPNLTFYIPPISLSTDNAGMIGVAAHYKFLKKDFADIHVTPTASLSIV